jgi:hypothetical protein
MTLDAVRASIFVADIIDELYKSTEVVRVVEGFSGVIVCSPLLRRVSTLPSHTVTRRVPFLKTSIRPLRLTQKAGGARESRKCI